MTNSSFQSFLWLEVIFCGKYALIEVSIQFEILRVNVTDFVFSFSDEQIDYNLFVIKLPIFEHWSSGK